MTDLDARLVVGTLLLDRYVLVTGAQTMRGEAWCDALDVRHGREVTIRALDTTTWQAHAQNMILARFAREVRALEHMSAQPGGVPLLDHGLVRDGALPPLPCVIMSRLRGHALSEALACEGRCAAPWLLPRLLDTLDALDALHARHLIHAELRPQRLFLSDPGTPREALRLLDAGMGLDARLGQSAAEAGFIVAHVQHAAPELLLDRAPSPALDVYQMGLILVEALWGRPVVEASSAIEAAMQHASGALRVPRALMASPLGHILHRALALDAEARYPDGGALAEALRAVDPATIPALPDDAPSVPLGHA